MLARTRIEATVAVYRAERALSQAAREAPVDGLAETILGLRKALWEAEAYRDALRPVEMLR